eukprot:GHRR01028465.1.p1 GENE.GHRR01028465.1~~GHRR01028465.1.p1  ORF type:complete len:128 (+),score=13.91 GHRR01028465.1:317-700(+)
MACLNSSRSSALSIEGSLAPISSTPYLLSMPFSAKVFARFRPVWPPIVGRMASGRSCRMMHSEGIVSTHCQKCCVVSAIFCYCFCQVHANLATHTGQDGIRALLQRTRADSQASDTTVLTQTNHHGE